MPRVRSAPGVGVEASRRSTVVAAPNPPSRRSSDSAMPPPPRIVTRAPSRLLPSSLASDFSQVVRRAYAPMPRIPPSSSVSASSATGSA